MDRRWCVLHWKEGRRGKGGRGSKQRKEVAPSSTQQARLVGLKKDHTKGGNLAARRGVKPLNKEAGRASKVWEKGICKGKISQAWA